MKVAIALSFSGVALFLAAAGYTFLNIPALNRAGPGAASEVYTFLVVAGYFIMSLFNLIGIAIGGISLTRGRARLTGNLIAVFLVVLTIQAAPPLYIYLP